MTSLHHHIRVWRTCHAALLLLACLATRHACAQPAAPLPPLARPPATGAEPSPAPGRTGSLDDGGAARSDPPRQGHETERQTIDKCLADLAAADVNLRRRAAMVLGKYRTADTQAAMIRCLQDPDDTVRQTALVALSETDFIAPDASMHIFRLLKDPNVHIRRIASSLLKTLSTRPIQVVRPGPVPAGAIQPRGMRPEHHPELQELLAAAIADEDSIVRKNALEFYPLMGKAFDDEQLQRCLADPDREIRVLALRAYGHASQRSQRAPVALMPLVDDPDPIVRKELAISLGWLGNAGVPLLKRLAADPDTTVRVSAVEQLARLDPEAGFTRLAELLESDAVSPSQRSSLVPFLRTNPRQGMPLLMRLAQEASGPVRAAAVRALGDLGDQGPAASFFLECLADGSGEVRRAAADSLRAAQPGKLAAAQIVPLTSSPHADVRLVALDLSLQLGAEPAADIIAECLLDEDTAVRIKAIGYAAIRNVPGWSVILRQSLADPSIEIQRATIETLLRRRDPESRRILAEYAEACASPELAAYLRARLQQLANDQARPQRVPNAAARERQLGLPTPAPAPGRPAPRP